MSHQGTVGWAYGTHLVPAGDAAGRVYATSAASLRERPRSTAATVGMIPSGAVVATTGVMSGEWQSVRCAGTWGWAYGPQLRTLTEAPTTRFHQPFTAGDASSVCHVYADGLDLEKPVGLAWFFDGDYFSADRSRVLRPDGTEMRGIAAEANRRNCVLVAVVTPRPVRDRLRLHVVEQPPAQRRLTPAAQRPPEGSVPVHLRRPPVDDRLLRRRRVHLHAPHGRAPVRGLARSGGDHRGRRNPPCLGGLHQPVLPTRPGDLARERRGRGRGDDPAHLVRPERRDDRRAAVQRGLLLPADAAERVPRAGVPTQKDPASVEAGSFVFVAAGGLDPPTSRL